jgi:hypothetical protein
MPRYRDYADKCILGRYQVCISRFDREIDKQREKEIGRETDREIQGEREGERAS